MIASTYDVRCLMMLLAHRCKQIEVVTHENGLNQLVVKLSGWLLSSLGWKQLVFLGSTS